MRRYTIAGVIGIIFTCGGCATAFTKSIGYSGLPYSGASCDFYLTYAFAAGKSKEEAGRLLTIFPLIDAPLSIVADTIFLPIDIFSKRPEREGEPAFGTCYLPGSS